MRKKTPDPEPKTAIERIWEVADKFNVGIRVSQRGVKKDGSRTVLCALPLHEDPIMPDPVPFIDRVMEEAEIEELKWEIVQLLDYKLNPLTYIPKGKFHVSEYHWVVIFTIPPMTGPMAPQHLMKRISRSLKDPNSIWYWLRDVSNWDAIYNPRLYKVGEQVCHTHNGTRKKKYYYVGSYHAPGSGMFRLMREDGVLVSSPSIEKLV